MTDHILIPPTPERIAKGDVVTLEGKRGGRELRSVIHPLDYYLSRSQIYHPHWAAGIRYGETWHVGYMRANIAQLKYSDPLNRGKFDAHYPEHCRDEYDRASLHLRDMATRKLLFKVCCQGEAAGRGNVTDLKAGLEALDRFYNRYCRSR